MNLEGISGAITLFDQPSSVFAMSVQSTVMGW
jgi:hypothetical protein